MENKICPLMTITSAPRITRCQEETCAWYLPPVCASNGKPITEGRCAVQALGALPELVKGVRSL